MPPTGEVVIVSGPPGSGKTTVSAALSREAERGVHVESDVFYRFITAGFLAPHLPPAHAQNTAVMDIAADAVANYADAGYTVYWDGIVGPWFLDRVAGRLAGHGIRPHYLVVRASGATAAQRVRERDGVNDVSGAEVMHEQMADLGEFETHVVDSDGALDDVLARCRAALVSGALRLDVDQWIDDRWPVSVKGVLAWDGQVVVLRNARDEWELPGGRLDGTDATPEDALHREVREELGIDCEVGGLIDSWIYEVEGRKVLILTFTCSAARPDVFSFSDEHHDVALMSVDALVNEAFPSGYLRSVKAVLGDEAT